MFVVSWLGEDEFLRLARAAEHHDEQPQLEQPELQTQQPRLRICVFAEPELRAGLVEHGAEWVGGTELMDAILAVRPNHDLSLSLSLSLSVCVCVRARVWVGV